MDLIGYFQPRITRKSIGLRKAYATILIIANLIVYVFSLLKSPYCCQNSKVSISVGLVWECVKKKSGIHIVHTCFILHMSHYQYHKSDRGEFLSVQKIN